MKLLLKAALLNKRHYILLVLTLFSMVFLTVATQMEMLSLGVIAKSGPDFFSLFGPSEKKEQFNAVKEVSFKDVEARWHEIDTDGTGVITRDQANAYFAKEGGGNLVQKVSTFLDSKFQLTTHLSRLALLLFIVAIIKAASTFVQRYTSELVSIRVSRDLRQRYFEHIQSLPMSFYHEYNMGSLSARVGGDAGTVAGSINALLLNYIQAPFAIITTLIACFYISWQLSLVVFVGFPLILFPVIYIARKIKQIAKQMQRNQESFGMVLLDFLAGIQTVKIFAMEDFSLRKYRDQNEHMAKLQERSARFGASARPILHTISSFFFVLVILTAIYFFRMGVAEILVFCGLLYVLYEPVKKFAEQNNQIFVGIAAAERMYEVLNIEADIKDAPEAKEMKEFKSAITFKDVSFRYQEDWILKDLSFTVEKGQTVALVGPTGAGKSTIVQLLPRLYDVQKGEILFDGKPISHYTQKSIRENIAFVPQKPFLFFDTVRENICFGRKFDHKQVVKAAERAHASEFIETLPNSYDTMLSELGKNLSGGQQQRLAIARALVKGAPILVMDEATSSLDSVSENRIKNAIVDLQGEVTQVIIAHRLSTIEHADKIIYLEKGRKVAEGTKDELMQTCKGFRLMWEMMFNQEQTES